MKHTLYTISRIFGITRKSKNPANRAIAGFLSFDSIICDPAGT